MQLYASLFLGQIAGRTVQVLAEFNSLARRAYPMLLSSLYA